MKKKPFPLLVFLVPVAGVLAGLLAGPLFAQEATPAVATPAEATVAVEEAPQPPTPDPRVKKALDELELVYDIDDDGDFKLVFELDNDRTQLVYVMSTTEEYRSLEVREIWSFGYEIEGGNIPAPVANRLLEDTFDKKLGAWAKVGERATFITRVPAETDPETLYSTLLITLEVADEMESRLTPDLDDF